MARRKLSGGEDEVPPPRISVIVTHDLIQRIEALVACRETDKSKLIREWIRRGLEAEERGQQAPTAGPRASQLGGMPEEQPLSITLSAELQACIDLACRLLGLEAADLVRLVVAEQIGAYIQRGLRRQEDESRRPAGGGQQWPEREA